MPRKIRLRSPRLNNDFKQGELPMAHWMNLGQNFKVNAKKFPDKLALKDHTRSFTYAETNRRVNQLGQG